MKKIKMLLVALICMTMMLCQAAGMNRVEAASKKKEIYHFYASGGGFEKTTKGYDICGSTKKDTITIDATASNYSDIIKVTIKINGYENILSNVHGDTIFIHHIKLKNGKRFLLVNMSYGKSTFSLKLYKCSKSGQLSVAKDFKYDMPGLTSTTVSPSSKSSNHLTLKAYLEFFTEGTPATIKISAKYKSTKYKTPSTWTVTSVKTDDGVNKLYAADKLTAYKSAGSTKKKFTISKGKKITLKSITRKNYVYWYKVKYGKKTGYVKDNQEYPPFASVVY
ncbi:MAG: hypothetical protein J6P61_07890 [Erysipelotrichaceae bacterium]|nr:hypothetical protein [Erysipelotrichaceae bacterium]